MKKLLSLLAKNDYQFSSDFVVINKLKAMSDKCRFIRYSKEIRGYCLNQPFDHKMFMARGVIFFRKEISCRRKKSW